jgi:hypothetical protein
MRRDEPRARERTRCGVGSRSTSRVVVVVVLVCGIALVLVWYLSISGVGKEPDQQLSPDSSHHVSNPRER